MSSPAQLATFRDPEGSLTLEGAFALRTVRLGARSDVLALLEAPFFVAAVARGEIVSTQTLDGADGLCLRHPRIAVASYPWEWTPGQWLAAAELTLKLCEEAAAEGWILKDATPLNILFVGARPVLVDVLSFDRRDPGSSLWFAYGQYVRTFLLPLLLNRTLHWPLAMTLLRRDGYEPAEILPYLGILKRFSPALFWPVTLPAWLERRAAGATAKAGESVQRDPELTLHVLRRTLASLRKRTQRAVPEAANSSWSQYQATRAHYTGEQSGAKREWIRTRVVQLQPRTALDVGANTGEYSALLAEAGAEVVALERDSAAAGQIFRMSQQQGLAIQTIQADLARPSPAVGWENRESASLLQRLEGQFDVVLLLAVIHHLLLLDQIPLRMTLELCHRITRGHLILEWIPVSDPMFQEMMRGREHLYGALGEQDLIHACDGLFTVLEQHRLENGRSLFLLERV